MKKIISTILLVALSSLPLFADSTMVNRGGVISVNGTSQTTQISGTHLGLINDGSANVYLKVNGYPFGGTNYSVALTAANTDDFFLKGNETFMLDVNKPDDLRYLYTVCAGTNTSTLRYFSR